MKAVENLGRIALTLLFSGLIVFLIGLYGSEYQRHYGYTLFVALPLVSGFGVIMVYGAYASLTVGNTILISMLPLIGGGMLFLGAGQEGFICIAMAIMPMVLLAVAGGLLAWLCNLFLSRPPSKKGKNIKSATLPFVILFVAMHLEPALVQDGPLRCVQTEVFIEGAIDDVWETVVAFPAITEGPTGLFRFGIAYPLSATIEGTGVGALRRCTFNTGDFVEPITVWDAPHHLAFDVTENPLPMREWSFYGAIDTPHLHGFMVSERGEFRLSETGDGRVALVGTTWYHHELWPNFYWGWISDGIIHQIHQRVLNHIKVVVESGT